MKKIITWTLLIVFSTFNSPALLKANAPEASSQVSAEVSPQDSQSPNTSPSTSTTPAQTAQPLPAGDLQEEEEEESEEPIGTPVSAQGDNSAEVKKRRTMIGNFVLAGTALVVAIVSILVVSNGNGKKK